MKKSFLLIFILTICAKTCASSFGARRDQLVYAVDLKTGNVKWTHKMENLSEAHFALHPEGLVAYLNYDGSNYPNPSFLDPISGTPIKPFLTAKAKILSKSRPFWPPPKIELSNGWSLVDFSPGNVTDLTFSTQGKTVWKLNTEGYPDSIGAFEDIVYYSFGYLAEEGKAGVVHAYKAGSSTPLWLFDANRLKEPSIRLRLQLQVFDESLLVHGDGHLFSLNPKSGELAWHTYLPKIVGAPFSGGFYRGGLNLASIVKVNSLLIVSYECRVIAFDTKSQQILWQIAPDSFPSCPFPLAYGDTVYLTGGKGLSLIK